MNEQLKSEIDALDSGLPSHPDLTSIQTAGRRLRRRRTAGFTAGAGLAAVALVAPLVIGLGGSSSVRDEATPVAGDSGAVSEPATALTDARRCNDAQRAEGGIGAGYEVSASIAGADGTAVLFREHKTESKVHLWFLCTTWADSDAVTLFPTYDDAWPEARHRYLIGTNTSDATTQFTAGGPVETNVTAITYEFADGHTEKATIADGMWLMAYAPTSGPLATVGVPRGTETVVRVTYTSGRVETYTLTTGSREGDKPDYCQQRDRACQFVG